MQLGPVVAYGEQVFVAAEESDRQTTQRVEDSGMDSNSSAASVVARYLPYRLVAVVVVVLIWTAANVQDRELLLLRRRRRGLALGCSGFETWCSGVAAGCLDPVKISTRRDWEHCLEPRVDTEVPMAGRFGMRERAGERCSYNRRSC